MTGRSLRLPFSRHIGFVALLLAGLMPLPRAVATTVVAPDFEQLADESDYIVRARVIATESYLKDTGGREVPHTRVTLEVLEVIAGTPPAPLVLDLLGGAVGDVELLVHGVPTFTVGQEDVLFIRDNGRAFHPLHGVMHGRYPVRRDKATGRTYLTRSNGVPLADVAEMALPLADAGTAQLQARRRTPADALTPAELSQRIRDRRDAAQPGGRPRAR